MIHTWLYFVEHQQSESVSACLTYGMSSASFLSLIDTRCAEYRNGAEYISTVEHIKYPFFGTQWHPGKPPYEFSLDKMPHSRDAVHVTQHLADMSVDYARHSSHKPQSKEEELAMLIYNYEAYLTSTARDIYIVMEPSYDGPDITHFFDPQEDVNLQQPGVRMGVLA